MADIESSLKHLLVIDIAIPANERETCVVELTDDEAKIVKEVLKEMFGEDLKPVD